MMRTVLTLSLIASAAPSAFAQLPQTRLYSVLPPGVPPGRITDLRINTGVDLDEVDRLIFNHPGIFATRKQQPDGRGGFQPIANTFRVAVEADVPPGRYEVRAVGLFGTSNPRSLTIDPRPAVGETEPNNTPGQAQSINVGTLVDGQINGAGDLDVVRFSAGQGERIVIDCLAERIDSKLNPMLTLLDADVRPIAFARNEYGRDAFLVFDVPADGDYFVELRDETFAGGAEHFYRLQIHRGPHIRFVMPPAGIAGTTGRFSLYGYNLPGSERVDVPTNQAPLEKLEVDIPVPQQGEPTFGSPSIAAGLDLFSYRHASEAGLSNAVTIGLAAAPVALEQEPNDEPAATQKLTVPFDVAGQFIEPADIDRFSFEAAKDQSLWIEVIGQRGGSRIDPFLTVEQITHDAAGIEQAKTLTAQDDTQANLAANTFDTATDDPAYSFKAPQTGTYRLTLRDRASGPLTDPSRVYRLIVREPQPDFRLVAVPSGQPDGQTWPVSPHRGGDFSLDMLAFRRDGFTGPIEVRPLELPPGITTLGTVIRENETSATLVLTASELAATDQAAVRLVGSAQIPTALGQTTVEHPVRSGGVVWSRNGNTPAISQLESDLIAAVSAETAPYQLTFDLHRTTVSQGRQLLIPMTLIRRGFTGKLTLKFDGVSKKARVDTSDVVFENDQNSQSCRLFIRPDAPPGKYVLGGTCEAQVPYSRNPLQAEVAASHKAIADHEAQLAKHAETEAAKRADAQTPVLNQAFESLQQAEAAQKSAEGQLKQAQQALATARQQQAEALKQVAGLTKQIQTAKAALEEATKSAADTPDEEDVKMQIEQAQQTVEEQQAALKSAQEAQANFQSQLAQAETAVKPAEDALATAQQTTAQAQAARLEAQTLTAQLKALAEQAANKAKSAVAARAAAEKAATDAANAAKPKNLAVNQPMPPIILTITPAPIRLEAKPARGDVKPGETIDVALTIKRQNDFAGPVKLSLAVPDGVTGLSAAEVDVAADADSGVLNIAVTADAPGGEIANLVVRAQMDAGGPAIVEAPLTLKVTK